MWIDIHAHLYELSREEILDRMNQAVGEGVAAVINAATSIESASKVLEQSAYHQQLYATLGVSAFDVEELGAGWDTTGSLARCTWIRRSRSSTGRGYSRRLPCRCL